MDTKKGTTHTGAWEVRAGRDRREWGYDRGGIALGEIPNVDDRVIEAANHHGTCKAM